MSYLSHLGYHQSLRVRMIGIADDMRPRQTGATGTAHGVGTSDGPRLSVGGSEMSTQMIDELGRVGPLQFRLSRKGDVVKEYGDGYRLERHHYHLKLTGFNLEYPDLGLEFCFSLPYLGRWELRPYDEKRARLSAIVYQQPFGGRTSKGIEIGTSTLRDVNEAYGQPSMRQSISIVQSDQPGESDLSPLVYACYDGIDFRVKRLSPFDSDIGVERYMDQKVVKIVTHSSTVD